MATCRRRGCTAPVETYDAENWSSQCPFHNDADRDARREYFEDEQRAREQENSDADD